MIFLKTLNHLGEFLGRWGTLCRQTLRHSVGRGEYLEPGRGRLHRGFPDLKLVFSDLGFSVARCGGAAAPARDFLHGQRCGARFVDRESPSGLETAPGDSESRETSYTPCGTPGEVSRSPGQF